MNEKDLQIDLSRHVLYSKQAKEVVWKYLENKYPEGEISKVWDKIKL